MNKKFPLLFPVLVDHFKAIKGSSDDPDETDFEWSEGNFNFKVKEYQPDDYIPSEYNVLYYKNKFCVSAKRYDRLRANQAGRMAASFG